MILGKDHGDTQRYDAFADNWHSLEFHSDLSIERVYSILRQSHALIYLIDEPAAMQYVALECVYLGTPVIYKATTMLSRYMPNDDVCRINDLRELDGVLALLSDPANVSRQADGQRVLLSILAGTDEKWGRLLQSL